MKRWLGIATLVLAALVLLAGWATWSSFDEEGRGFQGARALSAKQLEQAKAGELVALEGTALERHTGPVSGEPAAWYRVTREHHWQERPERCRRNLPCRRVWGPRSESLPDQAAPTMAVKLAGGSRVLELRIPRGDDAVARVDRGASDKVPLDTTPTDTHKDDYETRREYLLAPGAAVTIVGTVSGSGADRTIEPKTGLALVYDAPREAMLEDLRGYENVGIGMMGAGLLIGFGGITLIRQGRRASAAARRVLTHQIPGGTVLGGVDSPMSLRTGCLACGTPIELEYHDIQRRWYAARTAPTRPGWKELDVARPLAEGETALDMSCSHCAQPLRLIVRADEWRMSLWRFHLVELLVLAPQPDAAEAPAGPIR